MGGPAARIEFRCFVSAPFRIQNLQNSRKIARMAPNLTNFGPNRSRRCELKFEIISNDRANEQTNELYNFFFEFSVRFRFVFGGKPEDSTRIIVRDDCLCLGTGQPKYKAEEVMSSPQTW